MGYSFTWILNHLSQSYQVASASWAAYAVTASYVPILAGPNITVNYYPSGIAITGSAGGSGTPGGPLTSIQFNSASAFSGSANFTFNKDTDTVSLTGSLNIISGGLAFRVSSSNIGPIAQFTGTGNGSYIQFHNPLASAALGLLIYPYNNGVADVVGSGLPLRLYGSSNTVTLETNGAQYPIYIRPGFGTSGGNVFLSGSLYVTKSLYLPGLESSSVQTKIVTFDSSTGQVFYITSSLLSASYASTASVATSLPPGTYNITASWANNALTASYTIGAITEEIWVRSTGDNSAVIDDDAAHRSIADGQSGVAYGDLTYTFGDYASSQGKNTEAIGTYTHAEGVSTYAIGEGSHAEGYNTRTGVEGEPIVLELDHSLSIGLTLTQAQSAITSSSDSSSPFGFARMLAITASNSSLNGLVFHLLPPSSSLSGSATVYLSHSLAIYDGNSRQLVKHQDLSQWYDSSLTNGSLSSSYVISGRRLTGPQSIWYENHTDKVYLSFNTYVSTYSQWRGWLTGSYDGINPPSIYLHTTASFNVINNIQYCWTGSIASPTSWTGSAPSTQYNGSQLRIYPPAPGQPSILHGFTRPVYNSINNKTYIINDNSEAGSTFNGILIINPDHQFEYTGSIIGPNSTNGVGGPALGNYKLSYTIHGGHQSVGSQVGFETYTVLDPGYRSSLSGSILSGHQPVVDKSGKVWYGVGTTTAGNPINLFALKATATLSSSNADTFAYLINHQNMGISASHTAGPYYYPGDGTNNSERIFVYVNYPYGSGSQAANYKKWLGYDLNGVLRDNPWNVTPGLDAVPSNHKYVDLLYWWNEEKVFVYLHKYILNKDGSLVGNIVTSGRKSGTWYGGGNDWFSIPQSRTLVSALSDGTADISATSHSIYWLDKQITSASIGQYSHAEGIGSAAGGIGSHAEGYYTIATGSYSHAEGVGTRTTASGSHAEGYFTSASGDYSHAEGSGSVASGIGAHAEGNQTIASGRYSHAEGSSSVAFGTGSHAGGLFTVASGSFQTTIGTYNLLNNTTDLFVIGDGASTASRHDLLNASTGVVRISGSLIVSNSFQLIGNGLITGSLLVSGSISSTSPFLGTASWAQSASQALSSSWTQPGGPYTSIQFNDSNTLSGSANYTFNKSNNQVQLTGSLLVSGTLAISSSNANQTQPAMQVNTQGVLGIGEFSITPTVVVGAIIYSGSEYYLGFP